MTASADPRDQVTALAAGDQPYLLGVRHHSPALAAMVPALLAAARPSVICVELPADFQEWLPYLADPQTIAPVALAGAAPGGGLGFYPFADFSPELAALRWATRHGVEVLCCDLPLADPGWSAPHGTTANASSPAPRQPAVTQPAVTQPAVTDPAVTESAVPQSAVTESAVTQPAVPQPGAAFAAALTRAGTGRDGDDLWDRAVEVLAPGSPPEAVRRAALAVGWALRQDAQAGPGIDPADLAREAHMREVIAGAMAGGRRAVAVIGAFHAPAVAPAGAPSSPPAGAPSSPPARAPSSLPAVARARPGAEAASAPPVTSLVPYAFGLLDSRSGYPAGIRDPMWQQAVFAAGGDPERVGEAAARAITALCRELRKAGHPAGTGEAAETLRMAADLARLRGLPAPGRSELLEAVTAVLGQGEPLGRGRALARALEVVLVGSGRGATAPGTPRSGLGPAVEAELAQMRLPGPHEPDSREVRLDPLRSRLDRRREVLLQRLLLCGAGYGTPGEVAGTGDGTALTTRWRLGWNPGVPARLDLAGVRGVTPAQAASGTLRERFRRESLAGGPTSAQALAGLADAARCDLPDLVASALADVAGILPGSGTLPELLRAADLTEALRRQHLPGTTAQAREQAAALGVTLLESAVRALAGLAGSDNAEDAAALVALAGRVAEHRLGLRLSDTLDRLAAAGSPLIQGAALAARVLLDLDEPAVLGSRVAGWVDAATHPDARRELSRRLAGLLTGAGPLLESAPAALAPLMDRIAALSDQDFLGRLPALRGGFDSLAPAARDRLLAAITERLGRQLDLGITAPPGTLARWMSADLAALAALRALGIPLPGSLAVAGPPQPPVTQPPGTQPPVTQPPVTQPPVTQPPVTQPPVTQLPAAQSGAPPAGRQDIIPSAAMVPSPRPAAGESRLSPADRWRLLLGRQAERLPAAARRYADALDELYGAGQGEGAAGVEPGRGRNGAGQGPAFPTAREWASELEALFGAEVCEDVLARAADAGRADVLAELDPGAVRPSVELLTSVLSLAGGMPEQQLAGLRPLVRRLVEELTRELATRVRPALTGLATPRPTRRPGGRLDLHRTLRENLATTRRLADGRTVIVPERPVFSTRSRREADWRLILAVDVSGSMEASVVWSALTAAVLAGVPALSAHFLAFSTDVIDLTGQVSDPLSLLLEVRVGGGTHIAAALAHARTLVTVPARTLVVVVSDFEEGAPPGALLAEVRALAASGVHLLGCAALDWAGQPRYSVAVAGQLAGAGMPVAAVSPLALARWVGSRAAG